MNGVDMDQRLSAPEQKQLQSVQAASKRSVFTAIAILPHGSFGKSNKNVG